MENILKLHEAIVVVLINIESRSATTTFIAHEINLRILYKRKDGKALPAYQVKQRAFLSNGKYHSLFQFIKPDILKLK